MAEPLLPLFPLSLVLLPRTPLPLHIFEDRYKDMMGDILDSKSEFGVVLAGDKGIVNVGCTATVEKVLQRYPDGRLDLISLGRRRFEILLLNNEKSYLRASVEYFDDEADDSAVTDGQQLVIDSYKELVELEEQEDVPTPQWSDPQLSFQLAQPITDLNFRQVLLSMRSELERMKKLAEFLPEYVSKKRYLQQMRTLAPRNGHGKWPPSV